MNRKTEMEKGTNLNKIATKNYRYLAILLIIFILALFMLQIVEAHSGRTNSAGCHNNKKTGDYHCHGVPKSSSTISKANSDESKDTYFVPKTSSKNKKQILREVVKTRKEVEKSMSISISEPEDYVVTEVIDGDTIKVKWNSKVDIVRVVGIDAPEIKHNQRYSSEAKEKTKSLVGKKVKLTKDSKQNDKDKFGRSLRYIEVNGEDFGAELVKEGYAKAYTKISSDRTSEYKRLESQAKINNFGLWNGGG